jgi:hypothetical protein
MRRIATISALAALLTGLPLADASAGGGRRGPFGYGPFGYGPFAYFFGPPAYNPAPHRSYAFWLPYYREQAERSFARRAWRANYYVGHGYNPPSRQLGPPTNYYAERYALEPYSYFDCPLARRGDGVCGSQVPLSVLSDGG